MSLSARYRDWRKRTTVRWMVRFSLLHHAHWKIASGIGWTLLFVVIARVIGAGREMAIAAHYGVGEIVDAYLFVFNLVSWPFAVWFSALSVVLVPTVIRLRNSGEGAIALQKFHAGLLGVSIVVGLAFAILLRLLFRTDVILPYIGFPASTEVLVRSMIGWLTPIMPLGFIVSFYSVWMMSTGRYVNTLIEAGPPLAILLALVLFSDGSAAPLLFGTIAGLVLQALLLGVALNRIGEMAAPIFTFGGMEWRQFWQNVGVMITGNILISATVIVDQIMAASLGSGTIATLGYANRIIALMLSLSALTVNRAVLPIFSGMRAVRDPRLPRVAMQWMVMLFLGGIAAAFVAWWCAPTAIALLFEHGAFKAENARAVVEVLSFALVQIPFYCGALVLNMQLAVSGRYRALAALGAMSLAVKVFMNWLLISQLGVAGISLASGIMYAIIFTMLVVLTRLKRI